MPPLKVTPLALESLRVRSSALVIESDDLRIVIDPTVTLAPALHEFEGDHHLAGNRDYRERIAPILDAGVAAEFLDIKPSLLEARRKGLFGKAEN